MRRETVSSSNLRSVGYDPSSATLEIEFNSGGVYQYSDVPAHVHDSLLSSGSLGRYFRNHIRDVYSCARVR
jgi:hypothetical protein